MLLPQIHADVCATKNKSKPLAANRAKSRGPVTAAGKRISAANSVHSTGPRTPEGKAISARNSERRHLLANSVALPAERTEEFLALLNDYRVSLQPVGFLEERVVETIAVADWSRRRYWGLGVAGVAHATAIQEQSSDDFTKAIHQQIGGMQTALAVSKLADTGRTLEFFRRCDAGYSREYTRARLELKQLQTDRRKREHIERLDSPPGPDIESCFEKNGVNEPNPLPTRRRLSRTRKQTYNRHMRAAIFIFLALLGLSKLAHAQSSPIKALMLDRVHPASNAILLTTFRGAPLTAADWTALQQNAATLTEAAAQLATQGAPAPSDWNKAAVELSAAASDTAKAAQSKDAKLLPAITTRIDATCTNCHKHYRPNVFPQGSK